jgi:hypothetical protein
MSDVFQNIDPPPPHRRARRVCTPRLWCGGRTHSLGGEGGGGSIFWKTPDTALYSTYVSTLCQYLTFFFFIFLYRASPRPHIPFTPNLILYVNLVAKGAPKFIKTLTPRLTVLDIPYFADAYSRTVRPIDLHNF